MNTGFRACAHETERALEEEARKASVLREKRANLRRRAFIHRVKTAGKGGYDAEAYMDSNTVLESILSDLRQKYEHLNRILEITREMDRACAKDALSFAVLLGKRQDAMDSTDKLAAKTRGKINSLPAAAKEKITELLSPQGGVPASFEALKAPYTDIVNAGKRNMALLKRIVEEDKRLNAKVKKMCNP